MIMKKALRKDRLKKAYRKGLREEFTYPSQRNTSQTTPAVRYSIKGSTTLVVKKGQPKQKEDAHDDAQSLGRLPLSPHGVLPLLLLLACQVQALYSHLVLHCSDLHGLPLGCLVDLPVGHQHDEHRQVEGHQRGHDSIDPVDQEGTNALG